MDWYFWVLWVFVIFLSTAFMAIYVRKYHKAEGIIAVYIIFLAISQILATKRVSDFSFLGLGDTPLGVIVYPFTYQLTDTINEHFGKKQTFKMVLIAFVTQVVMVIFLFFGTRFEMITGLSITNDDWNLIFQQSLGITAASWISFLITGYLDALLYHKVRQLTQGKHLWIRSIVSDVPMLFLDSILFVGIGFGFFQQLPWVVLIGMMKAQIITKWIFGIIDTPFIYLDRWIVESPKLTHIFQEKPRNNRVVLIFSGGMDSTTLLYRLRAEGKEIYALSFDYRQKHSKELIAAKNTCNKLDIPHKIVNLKGLIESNVFGNNALTSDREVPEGTYSQELMKTTVVPNRNMVMLSIAISYAITIDSAYVYYGAHAGDHAIYPDCRPAFIEALDQVARICDFTPVSIIAPYMYKSKADIVAEGLRLGVDYRSTWTCYKGEEKPCGRCPTCKERLEAFRLNKQPDPLEYQ